MSTKNKRLMICLNDDDLRLLEELSKELGTKQHSKVISFLLRYYFNILSSTKSEK